MADDLFSRWQKEQEMLKTERAQNPDLFVRPPMVDDAKILALVGIQGLPEDRPLGYLKLWPQDFVVEEVDLDQRYHTVAVEPFLKEGKQEEGLTLYADLVKIGLSTIEAREELAKHLGIDEKFIGTAGIKDRDALTAQRISFRTVPEEQLEGLSFPNMFLKNVQRGKGVVDRGQLTGNHFTIVVRFVEPVDEKRLRGFIENVQQHGCRNFYYLQRFGTPRLITHLLGLYILKGEYEEACKIFLTFPSKRELPYFRNIRKGLAVQWGRWGEMREDLEAFSYSFRDEKKILAHLIKRDRDFRGALAVIPQQVQLGVYAYSSYLFNRLLSSFLMRGEKPPETFPLVPSRSFQDTEAELYGDILVADGIPLSFPAFRDFPFLILHDRFNWTRVAFTVKDVRIFPQHAIFDFTLTKGSYATTVMAHFATLVTGLPVPGGIATEPMDPFEVLGKGSLAPTIERFKDALVSKVKESPEGGSGDGGGE